LKQQLLAPVAKGLDHLWAEALNGVDVGFCMSRYPVEVAELAIGHAHVGGVHVSVYDPRNLSIGFALAAHGIGSGGQFSGGGMVKQLNALFLRKVFAGKSTLQKFDVVHEGLTKDHPFGLRLRSADLP
jgi:hypothetical protein